MSSIAQFHLASSVPHPLTTSFVFLFIGCRVRREIRQSLMNDKSMMMDDDDLLESGLTVTKHVEVFSLRFSLRRACGTRWSPFKFWPLKASTASTVGSLPRFPGHRNYLCS